MSGAAERFDEVAIFFTLSLLTGFAIHLPRLYRWLAPLCGGGPMARFLHPWFGLLFDAACEGR